MKKIIATLLTIVMLVCCFSLPCMASDASNVLLVVDYNKSEQMITLSGKIEVNLGRNWITYYLLNPGKTRDDIPNHTDEDPVFSNYGEIDVDDNGKFNYSFKHTGDPDVYTLYFTANNVHLTKEIDTTSGVVSASSQLEALRGLPTSYAAPTGTTVKELFNEKVKELPSEMPVVKPAKIDGFTKVYVDVNKSDDSPADGTIDKPYKTIAEALKNKKPESGMVLYLRKGTYPMSDMVDLTQYTFDKDLPFIISNYENEEVTVVGGKQIDPNKFGEVTDADVLQRLNPDVVGNIKVVDLKKEYGITSYGNITTESAPALYVGGRKYDIARWPNSEMASMSEYKGEDATNGVIDTKADADGVEFCVEDIRPFSWAKSNDIWIYGRLFNEWTLTHSNVTEFNPETRSIRTTPPISIHRCIYDKEHKFYYYNVLEELDAPGEWFVDKETGKLYIYPVGDLSDTEIVYASTPSNGYVWRFYNCKNVIINGINFKNSTATALNIATDCEGVVVQNCSFENLNQGVSIQGKYSGVINSTFKNIDGKGIFLRGTESDRKNLIPSRLFAQNNTLYNTKGIQVGRGEAPGVGEIVSHNFISNNVGSCINVVSNEAIIEYNEIASSPRTPVGTNDSGAIYVQGSDMFSRGNHIRYNYIHDVTKGGPRAIYFDDMQSECYAYGNITENFGWMHVHTGSENTIYNNIFINSTEKYSVNITTNYYVAANSGADTWKNYSLEYSLMTKNLKPEAGYGGTGTTVKGVFAERYPLLKSWAELMYERIAEYEANKGTTAASAINAAKSSDILSEYTDKNGYTYNLNEYLSSCRDNYIENNVLINSQSMWTGVGDLNAGYVRTVCENNYVYSSDSNPFAGKSFSDETAYDTIRERNANFETIPFEKIGLVSEEDYPVNEETHAITPIDSVDISISANDLALKWEAVTGAQEYTVELATDPSFSKESMVESATTYDLSYNVKTSLESDTVYYWRVSTKANAKCAKGEIEISDEFKFKTLVENKDLGHNQVGVTVYSVHDMSNGNFNVTTYAYNTTDEVRDATIHIACYSEDGRLISTKSQPVTIQPGELTGECVFNFTASNTKTIKLFVWSADGNMTPYTFVKTINR